MNGCVVLLILLACFIAGAEASAPGATVAAITAAADVVNNPTLPHDLEAAIAAHH